MLRSDYKTHYKMYKAKKNVVYATMFTFAMLGGLGLTQTAKADTVANANAQPAVQAAVNSTASSVAPASQVSSASSSVSSAAPVAHTDQPASTAAPATAVNTFNVSRNSTPVTNVTQSLVQTNQNQAQNIKAEAYGWTFENNGSDHAVDTVQSLNQLNNGKPIPFRQVIYWKLRWSYDVTADQLKSSNLIDLGECEVTQSPIKNSSYEFKLKNDIADNTVPVKLSDGTVVGHYTYQNGHLCIKPTGTFNGVGSQHFEISDILCEAGYLADAEGYRNLGPIETTLSLRFGNNSYTTKIAAPQVPALISKDNSSLVKLTPGESAFTPGTAAISNDIIFELNTANHLTDAQIEAYGTSNGKSIGDTSLADYDAEYAFKFNADNTLTPSTIHIEKYGNVLDSNNQMHAEIANQFVNEYGGSVDDPLSDDYKISDAGDNLSLDNLKALRPNNISGTTAYYSRQNDGTCLVYIKVPSSDLKIKNFDALKTALQSSTTINLDSNPKKAIENTMNYYRNANALNGYPVQDSIIMWVNRADITAPVHSLTTHINPNTGETIGSPVKGYWSTTSSMASGQSAVKLHVINATNGADLKHLIHFVISLIY